MQDTLEDNQGKNHLMEDLFSTAIASFVLRSAEHEGCYFSMSSLASILVDVK